MNDKQKNYSAGKLKIRALIFSLAVLDDLGTIGQDGSASVFKISNAALFDFDGGGKTDAAVFRPSNGSSYLQRSTAGFAGAAFGTNGDIAVPSAYIP